MTRAGSISFGCFTRLWSLVSSLASNKIDCSETHLTMCLKRSMSDYILPHNTTKTLSELTLLQVDIRLRAINKIALSFSYLPSRVGKFYISIPIRSLQSIRSIAYSLLPTYAAPRLLKLISQSSKSKNALHRSNSLDHFALPLSHPF